MNKLIDRVVIFIITTALYMPSANGRYIIAPILIAIILSGLLSYLENENISIVIFIIYLIGCFFVPELLYFLPLICYEVVLLKLKWLWIFSLLPLISNVSEVFMLSKWILITIILVAFVLKHRSVAFENMEQSFHNLRDNSKEFSIKLERKNKELLEKQDYEIHLATVTERNRIARDIHDNVGHLLSRSILQVGALLAINKDEAAKESLSLLKVTLSEAMDSIRASVHDLHEKAIDLQTEIEKIIHSFKFCPIKFHYDINSNIEKNLKYCFIAVIKEALSNIIKHSNATEALVIIREHPALYQLVIQDNGSNSNYDSDNGIGIKNITDRVTAVGGNVHISTNKGFRIFISINK